jgi:pSer/pThr/pTyr-binding forkhead associated (FHA) protein
MTQPPDAQSNANQILLLTSEQQVHAFELSPLRRIAIGRHDSNDLRLASRTVSNFHAEIIHEGGELVLRDLGSTNGTYVNDEAIDEARLKVGDRLRVGNYTLMVHLEHQNGNKDGFFRYRRQSGYFVVGASGNIISTRAGSEEALRTLRASDPRDVSLPDLLKILTMNAQSVMLLLRNRTEEGRVYIRKDKIVHAEYRAARGEKALHRFFGWQRAVYGIYELPATPAVPRTIDLPTDTLLMEGMKQIGELAKLITQLPPLEVPLLLREDCSLPVSAHSPAEIEIYQAIIRFQTIATVLEQTDITDCRALRLIHALLRKGVFTVSEVSDYLLEDTCVFRPQDI